MLQDTLIEDVVRNARLLAPSKLLDASAKAKEKQKPLAAYLTETNAISENLLYEAIANHFHLPFIDLKNQPPRREVFLLLPEALAQAHRIVSFEKEGTTVKVANTDPTDLLAIEFVRRVLKDVKLYVTSPSSMHAALQQYHKGLKIAFQELTAPKPLTADANLEELAQDLPVVRIVDTLIEYALYEGASDIHIEPTEKDLIIRYRIDGVLRDVMTFPKAARAGIVARIKILSNLKLDEHRLAQDGRIKIATDQYKVSLRVSIIPVYDGEKIVLRVLNESAQVMSLDQLGLQPRQLDMLKQNIKKPHGMILSTGPTGSGKTTTLYTILNILNTPGVNISTIEDPIEYRIPRVNQSQVAPKIGFSFASGLRALLRQDPNIIMVGEIRDNETAEIAVHSAMTGHLVLSTLHTNDAVTTLPRLTQMDVPAFLVATTVNLVIAQRLVRKICLRCIISYTLSKKAIEELEQHINVSFLLESLAKHGAVSHDKQTTDSLLFFHGRGCRQCGGTGYKGRIGIYELLEITPVIREAIASNKTSEDILKLALADNMITLMQDGFLKAKSGITTLEEVLRVTKE